MKVNHPRFNNTKSVNYGNNTLMVTSILTEEKNYDRWVSEIINRKIKAAKYRFLLLPAD